MQGSYNGSPFLLLGHDTADCIATQGLGVELGAHGQARGAEQVCRGTRHGAQCTQHGFLYRDTIFVSWQGGNDMAR